MKRFLIPTIVAFTGCMVNVGQPATGGNTNNNTGSNTNTTNTNGTSGTVLGNGTRVVGENETLPISQSWTVSELQQLVKDGTTVEGKAWTVLEGQEVLELPIKIVGWGASPITGEDTRPYLRCQTTGAAVWTHMDNIPGGFSGSSLVLNGRLVGAGAFSYEGHDGVNGLITFTSTPFQYMLEAQYFQGQTHAMDPLSWFRGSMSAFSITPDAVEYFSRNPRLKGAFTGIRMTGGGDTISPAPNAAISTKLRPGSAVAMNFVRGSLVNASAGCTVTAVDGDTVWACGHPVTAAGNDMGVPLSAAWVNGVFSSPFGTFKDMGPVGPNLGAWTGDWFTSIIGSLHAEPRTLQVITNVQRSDVANASVQGYNHTIARGAGVNWLGYAAVAGALAPLRAQMNYAGLGTADVRIQIASMGATTDETHKVKATFDLASEATDELFMALLDATDKGYMPLIVTVTLGWAP